MLTKRGDRLEEVDAQVEWPANVWMGVSVENSKGLIRNKLIIVTGFYFG